MHTPLPVPSGFWLVQLGGRQASENSQGGRGRPSRARGPWGGTERVFLMAGCSSASVLRAMTGLRTSESKLKAGRGRALLVLGDVETTAQRAGRC